MDDTWEKVATFPKGKQPLPKGRRSLADCFPDVGFYGRTPHPAALRFREKVAAALREQMVDVLDYDKTDFTDYEVGMVLGTVLIPGRLQFSDAEKGDRPVLETYGLFHQDLRDARDAFTMRAFDAGEDGDFIEYLCGYTVKQACLLAGYVRMAHIVGWIG